MLYNLPLIEIGLVDLPKSGWGIDPPPGYYGPLEMKVTVCVRSCLFDDITFLCILIYQISLGSEQLGVL